MKRQAFRWFGLALGLALFLCAVWLHTSSLTLAMPPSPQHLAVLLPGVQRSPQPAGHLAGQMGEIEQPAAFPPQPLDGVPLAQTAVGPTGAFTTATSPIWWDTPPQSGSMVVLPSGETIIEPGPEDQVRVIIQLKGDPVARLSSHACGPNPPSGATLSPNRCGPTRASCSAARTR